MKRFSKRKMKIKTLLSYRTNVDETRLIKLLIFLENNIDAMDLKIMGDIVFRIISKKETMINVELLIPVNRQFESNKIYSYLPYFSIDNAITVDFCGEISELPIIEDTLRKYTQANNLKSTNNIYYIVRRIYKNMAIIDACLGIIE